VYKDLSKFPLGHPAHCVDWIVKASEETEELFNRIPVVYTYPNYAATHQPALETLGLYLNTVDFCYASYSSKRAYVPKSTSELPFHMVPRPFHAPVLVQYSGNDGAKVPGVSSACDRMVYMCSENLWNEFLLLDTEYEF
jgi:hypothetical protein